MMSTGMSNKVLERYYIDERDNLVRRLNTAAGSPENAEDVVQEAFTRALKYWDTFDENDGVIGEWFSTILKNALRDFKRDEWLYGMCEDIDDHALLAEEVGDLPLYISALTNTKVGEQRKILSLYFEKQYGLKDIHNITGHPYQTIHSIIKRFKVEAKEKYA